MRLTRGPSVQMHGVLWIYDYEGRGLDTFEDLARDGRCVKGHWF